MKTQLATVGLLLLCISTTKAQFGVGARGGLSLTTMTGMDVNPNTLLPKPGANVAVFGEFTLLNRDKLGLAVQPEFQFVQKGTAVKSAGGLVSSGTVVYSLLDYMEVPILAKMFFGSGRFKGTLGIGLYGGLLLTAKVKIDGSSANYNRSQMKEFDVGVILSGGLDFELGPGAMILDVRYQQGFIDPFPNNNLNTLHVAPSVTAGYVFRFGKKSRSTPSNPTSNDSEPEKFSEIQPEPERSKVEPDVAPSIDEEVSATTANQGKSNSVETKELSIVPSRTDESAVSTSDFEEMIALNKHFDKVASHQTSETDKDISAAEILSRFKSPDSPVIIQKNRVTVDYFSISQFVEYIRLNHFRYKITDRERDSNGLIGKMIVHRL